MLMKNKVILLLSGGIDSTVLLFWLLKNDYDVYPLHINYGQITATAEIRAIHSLTPNEILKKTFFMNVPELITVGSGTLAGEYPHYTDSKKQWYESEFFPNRNLLLLTLASSYGYKNDIPNISIGVVGRNSYNDTKKTFLNLVQRTVTNSLTKIEIIAPFAGKSRKFVIDEAISLKTPLEFTFSCNSLNEKHCLLCTSCLERQKALEAIGKANFIYF